MAVENFIWDNENQCVSWSYNGKVFKKKFENAHFASLNTQKSFVYVEAGQNYSQDQVYYLSFDGNLIFSFDKVSNKIRWQHNGSQVEANCINLENAQFYGDFNIIIAISGTTKLDKRMKGYSLDGKLLFEKEPPQGYSFMYLSTSDNKPAIVCDGGKENADKYGRSSWYYIIDTKTGDMLKGSLAY